MESAAILALIAILGSTMVALFKLLNQNTKALDKMTTAMTNVAHSNKRIADESKQRNGHLAELITEQGKQSVQIADMAVNKVIEGVQNVKTQNVINQKVEQSTVKDETIVNETVKNKE